MPDKVAKYLGPIKESIMALVIGTVANHNIPIKRTNSKEIARLISKGNIIGNFHGASEYGPRALGNRSILADPRNKNIRDKINKYIKNNNIDVAIGTLAMA